MLSKLNFRLQSSSLTHLELLGKTFWLPPDLWRWGPFSWAQDSRTHSLTTTTTMTSLMFLLTSLVRTGIRGNLVNPCLPYHCDKSLSQFSLFPKCDASYLFILSFLISSSSSYEWMRPRKSVSNCSDIDNSSCSHWSSIVTSVSYNQLYFAHNITMKLTWFKLFFSLLKPVLFFIPR